LANKDDGICFACVLSRILYEQNKIELTPQIDVDAILVAMTDKYKNENITTIDGVKIDFDNDWVHLRKSNTDQLFVSITQGSITRANRWTSLQLSMKLKR
jgi:phosphomannomutase